MFSKFIFAFLHPNLLKSYELKFFYIQIFSSYPLVAFYRKILIIMKYRTMMYHLYLIFRP